MPQTTSVIEPNSIYHIWTHANGNDNLFNSHENYIYFLEKYKIYLHPFVDTFAYCLMPNHIHLMIRVKNEADILNESIASHKIDNGEVKNEISISKIISRQFSNLFNSYAQAYNKMYKRKGSLFTPNFNRKLIDDDGYMSSLIAYIHNNPIHHGFTKDINNWPYSSWHAYTSNKKTKIMVCEGIDWFGNLTEFKNFHKTILSEKFKSVFE